MLRKCEANVVGRVVWVLRGLAGEVWPLLCSLSLGLGVSVCACVWCRCDCTSVILIESSVKCIIIASGEMENFHRLPLHTHAYGLQWKAQFSSAWSTFSPLCEVMLDTHVAPHTHTRAQKHTAAFHLQNKIEKKKLEKSYVCICQCILFYSHYSLVRLFVVILCSSSSVPKMAAAHMHTY